MRVAIPALLDSFGDYTIDRSSTKWKPSTTLRGPTSLRVEREQVSPLPSRSKLAQLHRPAQNVHRRADRNRP